MNRNILFRVSIGKLQTKVMFIVICLLSIYGIICKMQPQMSNDLRQTSKESQMIIPGQDVLKDLDLNVLTSIYHRYLQTLQRYCSLPTRVGNMQAGGWNICMDQKATTTKQCLVFSFSDKVHYGSFAEEMAKTYRCRVFLYNPKINYKNDPFTGNLEQINDTLETEHGISVENLKKKIIENSEETVNVLTLDINDREWDVIPKLLRSGILENTEQLSVRLHSSRNISTVDHYMKRLVVLRHLYQAGFRIFWFERDGDASCLHKSGNVTGCYFINMIRILNHPSPIIIPSEPDFGKMTSNEYGGLFLRYINSVQTACKELIRVGNLNDGGWDVCNDPRFRPGNPCIVYSFGIANDFSFDDGIGRNYGCKSYAFDPSTKRKDHQHSKHVNFYATGISDHNGFVNKWKMKTLLTIMEELGHNKNKIDILKMDVENSEWGVIPEMISSGAIHRVRQFYFEIHMGKIEDNSEKYKKGLILLRHLYNAGFRIYWTHTNPACSYRTKHGQQRTACYEIYTVNMS